ncbi:MAG: flavin reductase [Bacillota bacterium]|nr:flavin reductase [Bacillota bacterium]
MNGFTEFDCRSLTENVFKLIDKDWMLLTAGSENSYNTMTASWGGMGILWNKNVVFSFVRPQRYTLEFMEKNDLFSISFYPEEYRKALAYCGAHSGRDVDKAVETGLTPIFSYDAPFFEEARLVFVCKKLYGQFLNYESIIDKSVDSNYASKDYHKMYIGEIIKAYRQD